MEQNHSSIVGQYYYDLLRVVDESRKIREEEEKLCQAMKDSVAAAFIDCGLVNSREEMTIELDYTSDSKTRIFVIFSCQRFNMAQIEECLRIVGGSQYLGGFDVDIRGGVIEVAWNIEDTNAYASASPAPDQEVIVCDDPELHDETKPTGVTEKRKPVNASTKPKNARGKISLRKGRRVIRLYEQGKTIAEVARRLKVSEKTISRFLVRNNIPKRALAPKREPLTEEEEHHIIDDYRTGLRLSEIMSRYSIHDHHMLYDLLDKNGIDRRKATWEGRGIDVSRMKSAIVKLYAEGISRKEIMNRFDLYDDDIIYQSIREAGIPTHREQRERECQHP